MINEKVNISGSIPYSLNLKLEELAKKENRSKNYLITKAIEAIVDENSNTKPEFDFKKELELSLKRNSEILTKLANR